MLHGIDATRLEKHAKVLKEPSQNAPAFDKIAFHFPHTGVCACVFTCVRRVCVCVGGGGRGP